MNSRSGRSCLYPLNNIERKLRRRCGLIVVNQFPVATRIIGDVNHHVLANPARCMLRAVDIDAICQRIDESGMKI